MNTHEDNQRIYAAISALYNDSAITQRTYYAEFRRGWDELLRKALSCGEPNMPADEGAVYTVHHSFGGIDFELNFDQLKLHEWYAKELKRNSRQIFVPERFRRVGEGSLSFRKSVCRYEPDAEEAALADDMRNIIACALPALPPEMAVVYGNKWVDSTASPLRRMFVSLFWLQTDYVPAFLCSKFEVCLYLFLMDYCIIKENYQKVKDDELKKFLHIFRPSPMLVIKGLIKTK